MVVSTVMGKKKRKAETKKAAGVQRATVLTIRGTDEWRAWVERLAKHARSSVSTLVDHALAEFAANHSFEEPPPER